MVNGCKWMEKGRTLSWSELVLPVKGCPSQRRKALGRTFGARSTWRFRLRILLFARREAWPCQVQSWSHGKSFFQTWKMDKNGKIQRRRWWFEPVGGVIISKYECPCNWVWPPGPMLGFGRLSLVELHPTSFHKIIPWIKYRKTVVKPWMLILNIEKHRKTIGEFPLSSSFGILTPRMSSRDLLQRRATSDQGHWSWKLCRSKPRSLELAAFKLHFWRGLIISQI